MTTVFLFDVDGVLLFEAGYHAALLATVDHFTRRMGWQASQPLVPTDDDVQLMQSVGITSQFDMAPLFLASLIDTHLAILPDLALSSSLPQACTDIKVYNDAHGGRLAGAIEFKWMISKLGLKLKPGEYPAISALRLANKKPAAIFPKLAGTPLLSDLLQNSRDAWKSSVMRLFQNFTLGNQVFEQTYHLQPEVDSGSFLMSYDYPIVPAALLEELAVHQASGAVKVAIFSLRPSSPPREVTSIPLGYSPEAEMALERVGLNNIPVIGCGRIEYIAAQIGSQAALLQKPAPFHALAGILAAVQGKEMPALEQALALCQNKNGMKVSGLSPTEELRIHVFEDSSGGIRSARQAVEILERAGVPVTCFAWGIADDPLRKAALENAGAQVFPETGQAIRRALAIEGIVLSQ